MALTHPNTALPAYVPAVAGTLFLSTATKSYVKGILLHNTNTTSETVKIYYVPNNAGAAGAAATANKIFERALAANETFLFPLEFGVPLTMGTAGDTIQGATTTASKVTFVIFRESD